MPHTETIHFENARVLHALYGGKEANLKDVEKALEVRLTTRDAWLKIQGKKNSVEKVKDLFHHLSIAHERGVRIRRHEFQYALEAMKGGHGEKLKELWSDARLSSKRSIVIPKTFMQRKYLEAIVNHDLVFGLGPAGTGKTFLAVAMAAQALNENKIERIILTRPAVEAGEALGFLPGDLEEKILPYLRPLYDALYALLGVQETRRLTEKNVIEIAPLAYMRGRTLDHAFIILDEAQNTTTEQMFMLLTRMGAESKCVVTGDLTQVDLPHHKKSGLMEAVQALRGMKGIEMVTFEETDVLRHELVTQIIRAYKEHRGAKQTSVSL
ncbi:MAG: PhoH family protein [Verrucomicrobiota bacterium]